MRCKNATPCTKPADNGPLEFLAKGFLVKEHVRIAKLAVEAIFDMLDGLYDALEVRVAGKDNKCCAGLAVDASLVVEDAGREDVFRTLRAELIRDVLQRSSLAIFLMREAEDVMQTVHEGPCQYRGVGCGVNGADADLI